MTDGKVNVHFFANYETNQRCILPLTESDKNISDLWVSRQKLEDLYKKLLLVDLEYALDKKVEQEL